MFGWIPVLGPIIDGIFSFLNKKTDADVENKKTAAGVRTAEVSASVQTLAIFKDDIGVRLARDLIMFPVSVFTAVTVWDYFIVTRYPDLVWGTKAIPEGSGLEWLPYAVMMFLFGNLFLNRKQR